MESKKPNIRALKTTDIEDYYGSRFAESVRGLAVEFDGEILAVTGVLHSNPLQAFSDMKDALRKYPKTIIKTARKLEKILNMYEESVYAIADDEEANSVNFLKHVGFIQIEEGVFKWQK